MDEYIDVISFRKAKDLIGEVVSVKLKYEDNSFWFKITGCGLEDDGRNFFRGYDDERMNRKIFIKEIENIVL